MWHSDRAGFLKQLRKELRNFDKLCKKQGVKAAVRLNVLSDIPWEKHGIPQEFPDIFFYDSAERITEAVEGKSIGVITHKHIELNKTARNPGYFNVGVVYFRNDSIGKACLRFWRDCCIHPNNQFSDIFGSCGDQKYLELFEEFFDPSSIEILCHKVGNGAPWNFTMFDFSSLTRIVWRDPLHYVLKDSDTLEQDIVFNHFSHFTPDYNNQSFSMDRAGEWGPGIHSHPGVMDVYIDYMNHMIETKKKYKL